MQRPQEGGTAQAWLIRGGSGHPGTAASYNHFISKEQRDGGRSRPAPDEYLLNSVENQSKPNAGDVLLKTWDSGWGLQSARQHNPVANSEEAAETLIMFRTQDLCVMMLSQRNKITACNPSTRASVESPLVGVEQSLCSHWRVNNNNPTHVIIKDTLEYIYISFHRCGLCWQPVSSL